MILTRDFPDVGATSSGRERIVADVRSAFRQTGRVTEFRISSLAEGRIQFLRLLRAILHFLWALIRFRPLPLQVAIFYDPARLNELLRIAKDLRPDCIYADSIRTIEYVKAVRTSLPQQYIVMDLDDLMSKRMQLLRERREGISAGYLSSFIPQWIQIHILQGIAAPAVISYEAKTLSQTEKRACDLADRVVLNSHLDAAPLLQLTSASRSRVIIIPPGLTLVRKVSHLSLPLRFVFVGSDSLTQNRLTIEWLLKTWQTHQPATPLAIYGRMRNSYPNTPNVRIMGFAKSLADIYTTNSILLAPAFLGGGVKTKVLEAVAWGTPVIGNKLTFEGLGVDDCGLAMHEEQIVRTILNPDAGLPAILQKMKRFQEICCETFDSQRVRQIWCKASESN